MKKTIAALFILFAFSAISCKKQGSQQSGAQSQNVVLDEAQINKILQTVKNTPAVPVKPNEFGFIKTNYGLIKLKFYPQKAPNTCANFKRLANAGFFNGTTFHRVVTDFVVQGGDIMSRDADRSNDGTGEIGYTIDAEITDLLHERGSIAMARKGDDLNSASSQFYICLKKLTNLDGSDTVFAQVVEGMDVVDRIAAVNRDGRDNPIERVEMFKVWVGTE